MKKSLQPSLPEITSKDRLNHTDPPHAQLHYLLIHSSWFLTTNAVLKLNKWRLQNLFQNLSYPDGDYKPLETFTPANTELCLAAQCMQQ